MRLFAKKKHYPSLIFFEEKIQVVKLDEAGKRIIRLAEELLEPGVIDSGEVKNSEKLSQSLKKLFQTADIQEKQLVAGIPENKCYTKILDIPKLKLDELSEAVSWEADTYLPVESDKVYMDWKIIDEQQEENIKVLLIAVPKEIIDGYTRVIQEAGLTPVAFETTALSLIRLTESDQPRTMILDLEKRHAVLTISSAKAIEASSIVNLAEDKDQDKLGHLTQTMVKMIKFYEEKEQGGGKIERFFLSGEEVNDKIREKIESAINRKLQFVPILVENTPQGKEQNYALVTSLAKKEVEAPSDEYTLNLLPSQIQKKLDNYVNQKTAKLILSLISAITLTTMIASLGALIWVNNLNSGLESEKLQMQLLPVDVGKAINQTNQINRAAHTIVKIGSQRVFPQKRTADLLASTPEGILFTLINIDENQGKIQITGRARSRSDLLKFKGILDNSEAFAQVVLPISSLQRSENIEFTLTARIN